MVILALKRSVNQEKEGCSLRYLLCCLAVHLEIEKRVPVWIGAAKERAYFQ